MGDASSPVVERSAFVGDDGNDDRMDASGGGDGDDELRASVDPRTRDEWASRDEDEQDVYALAVTYVQNHELLRAAHVLRECTGPKARWLRSYARFLVRFSSSCSRLYGAR